MPIFYRIFNNTVYPTAEVDKLGWSTDGEHFYPPDEYFETAEFVIHRTCSSIGDWGIISAMPRLLKQYYPGCKVYVTSASMMEKLHGPPNGRWGLWADPYKNVNYVFDNNPYVDTYIDSFEGEIYHDHFRIKNHLFMNDPLILQMLRFHKIDLPLDGDYLPELYFSNEEIERFSAFKRQHFGDSEYGSYSFRQINNIQLDKRISIVENLLSKYHDLPFMYFTNIKKQFNVDNRLNADGMDVRLLLYMLCNAKVCTGTQTGIYDMCSRYTNVDVVCTSLSVKEINEHYLPSINYTFIGNE